MGETQMPASTGPIPAVSPTQPRRRPLRASGMTSAGGSIRSARYRGRISVGAPVGATRSSRFRAVVGTGAIDRQP